MRRDILASAAAVIVASNTAASTAATKRAGSNVELQTSVTEKLLKEGLINETDSEPIGGGGQHFPLWIKVPPSI